MQFLATTLAVTSLLGCTSGTAIKREYVAGANQNSYDFVSFSGGSAFCSTASDRRFRSS